MRKITLERYKMLVLKRNENSMAIRGNIAKYLVTLQNIFLADIALM